MYPHLDGLYIQHTTCSPLNCSNIDVMKIGGLHGCFCSTVEVLFAWRSGLKLRHQVSRRDCSDPPLSHAGGCIYIYHFRGGFTCIYVSGCIVDYVRERTSLRRGLCYICPYSGRHHGVRMRTCTFGAFVHQFLSRAYIINPRSAQRTRFGYYVWTNLAAGIVDW